MADNVVNLSKSTEILAKSLIRMGKSSDTSIQSMKDMNTALKFVDKHTKKLKEELTGLGMSADNASKIIKSFSSAITQQTKTLDKERASLQKARKDLKDLAREQEDAIRTAKDWAKVQRDNKATKKAAEATKKWQLKLISLRTTLREAGVNLKEFMDKNAGLVAASKKSSTAMATLGRRASEAASRQKVLSKEIDILRAKHLPLIMRLKQLGLQYKITNKQGLVSVRNNRNLGGSFSVLRSKILLTAFAINAFQKTIFNLVKAYGKQEAAGLKVKGTLIATGMAAGITFNEIKKLSKELQKNGVIGDEVNLQMSALMLTYDQIGRETFPNAMKAANDMATTLAMGIPTAEELKSTVTMLSKALQDPERGMAALRKVGFSLSATQEKQVKQFVHLNKVAKAQNVILEASKKQYGGMAKIIATSTLGQLNAMNMALGDMSEELGASLAPAILDISRSMKEFAESIEPDEARGFAHALGGLGIAFGAVWASSKLVNTSQTYYNTLLKLGTTNTLRFAAAQRILNIAARAHPYILLASALLVVIPILKTLMGGYKKAGDEAKTFADKHLELMDALSGTKLNKLQGEFDIWVKTQTAFKDQTAKVIPLYKKFTSSLKPGEYQEVTGALYKLIPGLKDLVFAQDDYIMQNTVLRVQLEKYVGMLETETSEIAMNISVRQMLIDAIKAEIAENEEQHVQKLIDSYKAKIVQLNLQKQAYLDASLGMGVFGSAIDFISGGILGLTRKEKLNLKIKQELAKAAAGLTIEAKENETAIEILRRTHEKLAAALEESIIKQEELTTKQMFSSAVMSELSNIKSEYLSMLSQAADAEIAIQDKIMNNDIKSMKESSEYKRAQRRGDTKAMEALEKQARAKTLPARQKAFRDKQNVARAGVYIDTAGAIMKAYKDYGFWMGTALSALLATTAGLQIAQIDAQKGPTFATGGLVGGRRHSQGGTPIEAERGEFVVRRSAVESIGVEALNRMNAGMGGGSNIVVNVSGNVMTQDFVEDELAEAIKEAARRGTDFGIS